MARASADKPSARASDGDIAKRLETLADDVVDAARRGRDPAISIPVRALSNIRFNPKRRILEMGGATAERNFFNTGMAKKFMQTMLVASCIRSKLIAEGIDTSIRDVYYSIKHTIPGSNENTVDEQEESDVVIEDLEVAIAALREQLHVHAESAGTMCGPLTITDRGDTINLRAMGSGGYSVPSIVEPDVIRFGKCDARFVLLVEKSAVWNRFNQDKFWDKHRCLLITGGGQPPRGVRRLVHRFHHELKLPIYVYVDNDPWGYYIYSVVKQGSINLAHESTRMAVPAARFIGLSSFDVDKYAIPRETAIRLNDQDRRRAKELLEYPWFQNKGWQREIRKMLSEDRKYEQEALSAKYFRFVTEEYIPRKLKEEDWLD